METSDIFWTIGDNSDHWVFAADGYPADYRQRYAGPESAGAVPGSGDIGAAGDSESGGGDGPDPAVCEYTQQIIPYDFSAGISKAAAVEEVLF